MPTTIDPVAVQIFAEKGIMLAPVEKRDYCWTFSPYLRIEPPVKDLEVVIRKTNYMGPIVHRVTVPNVQFENSHTVADKVLAEYLASLSQRQ